MLISDPWAEEREYRLQDGQQALYEFSDIRIEMLSILDHLVRPDWDRFSRHAIFGPTKLIELVDFTASHDRNHLAQWSKVFKAR